MKKEGILCHQLTQIDTNFACVTVLTSVSKILNIMFNTCFEIIVSRENTPCELMMKD